ncbi:hypothetical protein [Actinokineospora sp.]|uniref:hypothetical protein n=1 Tax=Actinokineospora sp. TaxID=1872133 RepID=UPI004037F2DB
MRLEDQLHDAMAARVAAAPVPTDLTERAVAGAARIRKRRTTGAVATTMAAVVAVAFAVVQIGLRTGDGSIGTMPTPVGIAGPARIDLISGKILYQADGGEIPLPFKPGMTVTKAFRANGSWLLTYQRTDTRDTVVVLVRADGSTADLGTGDGSVVKVTENGARAVIQLGVGIQLSRAVVVELPSGTVIAQTTLSELVVVQGWSNTIVLLGAVSGDLSPVPVDRWDPSHGPFVPDPTTDEFRILGRYGSQGQVLALTNGGVETCPTVVDPAADFAIRARQCGVGLFEIATSSPDGHRLMRWTTEPDGSQGRWESLDVAAGDASFIRLGVPPTLVQGDAWWESSTTVLVAVGATRQQPTELLRCTVDGSPCTRVPLPPSTTDFPVPVTLP